MSDNAYVQRMYPHDDDFDPTNARLDGEKLRIVIPGKAGSDVRSLRMLQNRPFQVYTPKEAEDYLESARSEFERASSPSISHVQDEEMVDPDGETDGDSKEDCADEPMSEGEPPKSTQDTSDEGQTNDVHMDVSDNVLPCEPTQMLPSNPKGKCFDHTSMSACTWPCVAYLRISTGPLFAQFCAFVHGTRCGNHLARLDNSVVCADSFLLF